MLPQMHADAGGRQLKMVMSPFLSMDAPRGTVGGPRAWTLSTHTMENTKQKGTKVSSNGQRETRHPQFIRSTIHTFGVLPLLPVLLLIVPLPVISPICCTHC